MVTLGTTVVYKLAQFGYMSLKRWHQNKHLIRTSVDEYSSFAEKTAMEKKCGYYLFNSTLAYNDFRWSVKK